MSINLLAQHAALNRNYVTTPPPPVPPPPASAPAPSPQPPVPQPITFAASSVATLSGLVGTPISSTTLATITCADAAMTISLSETVPGLTFSYAANVLSVAGTPTAPGGAHLVVVSYVASDGSYSIRGSTEHTVNITDAAVPFVVGSCASASGRVGQPIDVTLCTPSIAANVPSVTISANVSFPASLHTHPFTGQLSQELLAWQWTPGASSSGTLRLFGSPTVGATFSGTLTVTYRTAGWPQEVLGTSTHTINIAAAYVAPPPAPAPAPAPPAPAPLAPPTPAPAPSPGTGADPFLSSVRVLQRFNTADQILQDVAMQATGSMTGSGTIVNITSILSTGGVLTPGRVETGERIVSVQEIKPRPYRGNSYLWDARASRVLNVVTADGFAFGDGSFADTLYTSSLIRGYRATIGNDLAGSAETSTGAVGEAALFRDAYDGLVQSASGIDGADGNLAVECMVDIGAAAWASLTAAGSDQRLCPVLTYVSSTGAAIWMLGFVRSAGLVFPVFWRRVSGSSTGSFAVSLGSLTWRPGRFVHLAFCSEASGSAANTAAWFDGAVTDGGSVTLASLVTAATGTLRVGGAAPLIEWVVNTGRASTFIPFTGLVDEARITSASRYGAYIGPAVALPAAARVIPWPNY